VGGINVYGFAAGDQVNFSDPFVDSSTDYPDAVAQHQKPSQIIGWASSSS
jgi:hypothetical protein